jgi:hypothetical protein
MKNIAKPLFILIAPFLFSCQAKKEVLENSVPTITSNTESLCPENGECTTKILKNKSLRIKIDELNQLYYQIEDNANTSVVHFEFSKKADEGLQDGNYREEIIFEINNADSKLELEDILLRPTKMIYGRHCYCKGQAGYFSVLKGKLSLQKNKEKIAFNLNFTVTEVPQIIKKITYPLQ